MKSQELEETFFMAHGLTRMQRIFADFLFNPYRVNIHTRHLSTIAYALRAISFSLSPTVIPSYSPTNHYPITSNQ